MCFNCKEQILVFWWPGVPFCEKQPPYPMPRTIKLRSSKIYGWAYWANTCPKCDILQGDNHLFIFKTALFRELPISNELSSFLVYEKK